jgi:hypothetical protein
MKLNADQKMILEHTSTHDYYEGDFSEVQALMTAGYMQYANHFRLTEKGCMLLNILNNAKTLKDAMMEIASDDMGRCEKFVNSFTIRAIKQLENMK